MEYVLVTQGLSKHYKSFKALDGLTMHVPKGSVYGFVGRNGAGKTTLIRLICGLQAPTAGSYSLYGTDFTQKDIAKVRRRMGAVVETPSIYLDLTAQDNLKEQFRVLGVPSDCGIPELLKLVGLEDTGKKKARNFSLGMKQRLGIAVALAGDPDFLVLDEPVNGLDPQGIIEIRELILKLNRERRITVLISSPTHLIAILRMLEQLWKQDTINRNVQEIARLSGTMLDKFTNFTADLDNIDRHLTAATAAYTQARRRMAEGPGNLCVTARKIMNLGARTTRAADIRRLSPDNDE